ncbi:PREDICTED: X-ray radiation resistance-associated protein 1 [Tinamus guttatus]|uniref:X-ray radiation resistance-associated protein 1 n=1 Tax=Tinamus guttatus TaxID=94827 RepID=UPI00052F0DFF|nr:PREDICTED: X-ray radiation resistance-associated protein 1 [Tinamus guttatus]
MATTGLYKMGDGSSYATNCFPARNILGTRKEGAGHWLLARGAPRSSRIKQGVPGEMPKQRRKPQSLAAAEEDNVLDEPFLMKHHCLKNPSDLCAVNISSQNLVSAKEEDFEKFDCVAFINAAENLLTLEAFRKFPGLRELELSLNGLRNLKITAGDFLRLEDLDLSYNNLSPEDIWILGELSQLKVLRLTANGLRSLPPDLAGSWDSARSRFPSLEVLLLDDNGLSGPSVFASLAGLCSLRQLNLDRKKISAVPYLQQAESSRFFLHPALDGSGFRGEGDQAVLREGHPATARRDACAPFPELQHLSLAFNKIEEEADLLPVAFFPCLEELTFHGNPLATTTSGQPPLLTRLLQENLGIKLVRRSVVVERLHLAIPLKASRKVSSRLPKVPKAPLMLEAPAGTFPWQLGRGAGARSPSKPLPPIRPSTEQREEREEAGKGPWHPAPPEPGGDSLEDREWGSGPHPDGPQEATGSFFLTQRKRSQQRGGGSSPAVPERYRGYEELLGGDVDPDFIEPVGIQRNVQALSHLLRHPRVYRDPTPRLRGGQRPYVPRRKSGKMPAPPPRRTRAEVLEGLLLAMRSSTAITEVPLVSVLRGKKSNPEAYREALRLLREFQEGPQGPVPSAAGQASSLDELQAMKTLLVEVASKQSSSSQLQLPRKRVPKKMLKVKFAA